MMLWLLCYWSENRKIYYENVVRNPEIDPQIYRWLIFGQVIAQYNGKEKVFSRNDARAIRQLHEMIMGSYIIQHTKIILRWIIELNARQNSKDSRRKQKNHVVIFLWIQKGLNIGGKSLNLTLSKWITSSHQKTPKEIKKQTTE